MELRIALVQGTAGGRNVAAQLQEAGYHVLLPGSPSGAAILLERGQVDLLLLNLGTFETLAFIRQARGGFPQLMGRIAAVSVLPDTIARFCPDVPVTSAGCLASDLHQLIDRALIAAGIRHMMRGATRGAKDAATLNAGRSAGPG